MSDTARPNVSPHDFDPLRRLFNRGRCRACYAHEQDHPTRRWVQARPLRDKQRPFSPETTPEVLGR